MQRKAVLVKKQTRLKGKHREGPGEGLGCGKGGEQQAGWIVGKLARGFPDWMEHSNHSRPFPGALTAAVGRALWAQLFG